MRSVRYAIRQDGELLIENVSGSSERGRAAAGTVKGEFAKLVNLSVERGIRVPRLLRCWSNGNGLRHSFTVALVERDIPPSAHERYCIFPSAAISSHDGARQACHGVPARITSPSALHRAVPRLEPVPLKVSSSCRVPTSQTLTVSRPPDAEINRRPSDAFHTVQVAVSRRFDHFASCRIK